MILGAIVMKATGCAAARARWWSVVILVLTFLLLPGPERSLFSGAQLSSRGMALLSAVLLVAVFSYALAIAHLLMGQHHAREPHGRA